MHVDHRRFLAASSLPLAFRAESQATLFRMYAAPTQMPNATLTMTAAAIVPPEARLALVTPRIVRGGAKLADRSGVP